MSVASAASTSRQRWRPVMFSKAAGNIKTPSSQALLLQDCDILPDEWIFSREETIPGTLWNIQMLQFHLCGEKDSLHVAAMSEETCMHFFFFPIENSLKKK